MRMHIRSSFRRDLLRKISCLCRGLLELLLTIVGVDPHRDVRRGVASEVLDFLHGQTMLDPPGDAGVPKLVRVDIEVQKTGRTASFVAVDILL